MYCSSCGAAAAQGLSYCKHCGARLGGAEAGGAAETSELRAESLIVSAMVGLFVLGLLAITVLVGVLKAVLGLGAWEILAFALLSFLVMVSIEGVLVSRLWRRKWGAAEAGGPAAPEGRTTKGLEEARARALPEPAPSVTEEATRALEPAYRERLPR